ncbi:MAG: cohesin domain-containing protein [Microgenomates group bacterium]
MKKFFLNLAIIFVSFFIVQKTHALTFDLVAPEGQLQRGQEVKFTININTEGKSYSSVMIGMTYQTQYLQYISVSPGNTFSTVSMTPAGDGKMIINGSSTSPYSGTGVFAYVTFKIIATDSGSTQLCALFNPDITPTIAPTTLHQSTTLPTALPTSGITAGTNQIILGSLFIALAGAGFTLFKKI